MRRPASRARAARSSWSVRSAPFIRMSTSPAPAARVASCAAAWAPAATSSQRSRRPAGAFASMAATSPNRTATTMPSSTALATASSATPSSAPTTASRAGGRPSAIARTAARSRGRASAGASDGGELIPGGGGRQGRLVERPLVGHERLRDLARGPSARARGSPAPRRASRAAASARARSARRARRAGRCPAPARSGCSGRCPPARRGCCRPMARPIVVSGSCARPIAMTSSWPRGQPAHHVGEVLPRPAGRALPGASEDEADVERRRQRPASTRRSTSSSIVEL